MPSRDLPSNLLFPSNPLTPVKIPSNPPSTYVDPTDPYHINTQIIYDEPIVGPDDTPVPVGTEGDQMA
jgi:hypothetical protein